MQGNQTKATEKAARYQVHTPGEETASISFSGSSLRRYYILRADGGGGG